MARRGLFLAEMVVAWTVAFAGGSRADEAGELARRILDDSGPSEAREAIIRDHPELSVELVSAMVGDLQPGTKDEYRRIPWIWRVAIASGRRNEEAELRRLLDLAMPKPDAPLDDWRAVVIGGGIINGITQARAWPGERIEGVLQGHPDLAARWRRSIDLASAMADDAKVATGTRYDALRMLGVESWDRRGAHLFRYLLKGVHPELQQGAISGLGDVRSPGVAQALLSGLGHYSAENRALMLDSLLRDEGRVVALLDAVAEGRLNREALGEGRVEALLRHTDEGIRARAGELLKD